MRAGEIWICNTVISIVVGQTDGKIVVHQFEVKDKVILKTIEHNSFNDMFVTIIPLGTDRDVFMSSDLFLKFFNKDYSEQKI